MSKFDFIKDKNIVPIHKVLTLEYETEYSGQKESIDIRIYPYTVEEKLLYKNKSDEGRILLDSDNEDDKKKGEKLLEDATYEAVLVLLKKDDKNATLEHVKAMPNSWYDRIIFKALEFEGITEEDVKEKTKKEISKL